MRTVTKASLRMGADPTATPPLLQAGFLPGADPWHRRAENDALEAARHQRHAEHDQLAEEAGDDEGLAARERREAPAHALPRVEAHQPRRIEEREAGDVVELGVDGARAELRDHHAAPLDLEAQGLGEAGDEVL